MIGVPRSAPVRIVANLPTLLNPKYFPYRLQLKLFISWKPLGKVTLTVGAAQR
jgi:hypothetical protein